MCFCGMPATRTQRRTKKCKVHVGILSADWEYRMDSKEKIHADVTKLFSAKQGVTSEKIQERKVCYLSAGGILVL